MIHVSKRLVVPATVTDGTALPCGGVFGKYYQVLGITAGGKVRLKGKLHTDDAYSWISAEISADMADAVELPQPFSHILVARTVVGGTITVSLGGWISL